MTQNTENAAAAETMDAILSHINDYLVVTHFQTDEEILADIVEAGKAPNSAADNTLENPVCTFEEIESILWGSTQAEHAVSGPSDQEVEILDQHKRTGFVLENDLVCVLGDYVGPFGGNLRRCESGVHECRHLKTSDFGGGRIVIRQQFYSIKHMA